MRTSLVTMRLPQTEWNQTGNRTSSTKPILLVAGLERIHMILNPSSRILVTFLGPRSTQTWKDRASAILEHQTDKGDIEKQIAVDLRAGMDRHFKQTESTPATKIFPVLETIRTAILLEILTRQLRS